MTDYVGIALMLLMLFTMIITARYIWTAAYQKHVVEKREWVEKEGLLVEGKAPEREL